MTTTDLGPVPDRWARLRFAVIGQLLAAPPTAGALHAALAALAARTWTHPVTGAPARFGFSTIERWFHAARAAQRDPVARLARKVRADRGVQSAMGPALVAALRAQYDAHPGWTCQLHVDNLAAVVRAEPARGPMPSYATVRRYLRAHDLRRQRRPRHDPPARVAREVRSYEVTHVHALWHLDFHTGKRAVLLPDGRRLRPHLLGLLDDHSRAVCHAQWYLTETAQDLCHGFAQACQKRALPRAVYMDRGAAMLAGETVEGFARLGVAHEHTRAYSPEQNAKMEVFWAQVEGRLMPMLENVTALTLAQLNEATLAWIEGEYHRTVHAELGTTPLDRLVHGPSVGRPSPRSDALRAAFRLQVERTQRRSDGTFTLDGVRFEVPARYRTLTTLTVRYARWDLSGVELYDARHGTPLCAVYPLDKAANADRRRRALAPPARTAATPATPLPAGPAMAPRLAELIAAFAATGLPPAYLPAGTAQPLTSDPRDPHKETP